MLRYFSISLWLILASFGVLAQTQDTTSDKPEIKIREKTRHQLLIGYDITQPFINASVDYRKANEFSADYYWHNELYFVGEAGWGSSNVNYDNLKYTSSNNFFRVGINRSMLQRVKPEDWDMAFIGARYGMAFVQRSSASYSIADSLWGNSSGTVPGKTFPAAWMEVTGGMRVELLKGFLVGWTARGRFLLNANSFKDLAPLYIAGYGKGDKGAVFDFNVYLSYAIRWRKNINDVVEKKK